MNIKSSKLSVCILSIAFIVGCSRQNVAVVEHEINSNDVQTVQADIFHIQKAIDTGNADALIAYTYPKIIEGMGGVSYAKSLMLNEFAKFKALGMTNESFVFPEEPTFLKSGRHYFAIVPTKKIIIIKGERIESFDFQLGIWPMENPKWTYIQGSQISKNLIILNSWLPDFPTNYQFPSISRKKL
jgi:hypothetical protein